MRTIDVVICREADQWVAQALDVDVSSFGATPEEAHAAINEALHLFFEDGDDVEILETGDARLERLVV